MKFHLARYSDMTIICHPHDIHLIITIKKSRIRETKNLLTDAESSTNIFVSVCVKKGADSKKINKIMPPPASSSLPLPPPKGLLSQKKIIAKKGQFCHSHEVSLSIYLSVCLSVPFSNILQGLSLALRSHDAIPASHWLTPPPGSDHVVWGPMRGLN